MMLAKKAFVIVSRAAFRISYAVFSFQDRRDEVLFLSRQVDVPSDNFLAIGSEFENRGWSVVYHVRKLSRKTPIAYLLHVAHELFLLARCRVCVLDRYDPVVGLLNFKCDGSFQDMSSYCAHSEFPIEPVVVQLWHAFGAFKKFGFQSLDTIEGHTRAAAELFGIHRNYSWIVCTGEQNRRAFAEAFSCPLERVVALGLPEYDDLLLLKSDHAPKGGAKVRSGNTHVLFAPTLRKSENSAHPFKELARSWEGIPDLGLEAVWSFHPLEAGAEAPRAVSEELIAADIVVTDYSSIVYEAYLLGKPVLFYIPDIDRYRFSPGLNADPLVLAPNIAFTDQGSLEEAIVGFAADPGSYPQDDFDRFVGDTFDTCSPGTAGRIADFVLGQVSVRSEKQNKANRRV